MQDIQRIEELSNAFGPSGFEEDVVEIAKHQLPAGSILQTDSMRNLYIRRPQDTDAHKPVVLLDAHTDEVGFMVQAIRPDGQLQIVPLGGWEPSSVPAHTLRIRNRRGEYITGIVASKPPHYMNEAERRAPLDIANMTVDVGATSAAEVQEIFGIDIAAPIAPDTRFVYNEASGIMMGKAFDCRAGCAAVLDVMSQLQNENLSANLVGTLTTQEEVGTRGAKVAAQAIQPDVAIVFEGGPADDTFAPPWATQMALKKGPMLRHIDRTMIANPRLMRFAIAIAAECGISIQQGVRATGGTNGGAIHLAAKGVPTLVISLPVRYIHTHYGYAAIQDYRGAVAMGKELVRRLTPEAIAGL